MRKRSIRFALLLKDNKPVRTLEELESFYDNERVFQYFQNGQLARWLEQRGYANQLSKIEELKKVDEEFLKSSLKNILIKNEVYTSMVQKEEESSESFYNINKRASLATRSRVVNNKNGEEGNIKNEILQKRLKSSLGISEYETTENGKNLNIEDLSFKETGLYEELDIHNEGIKEKEENVCDEILESREEKVEEKELVAAKEEICHEEINELKEEILCEEFVELEKEDSHKETLESKEEKLEVSINKQGSSLKEISAELPKKSLSNSVDFTSIGKLAIGNCIENTKGESLVKGNKPKLNLNISLDKQKSIDSISKDIDTKGVLESKTNILNDASESVTQDLMKTSMESSTEVREGTLLDISAKNNEDTNKKELIDSKVLENKVSVKNNDDFDVDKIGEFITDPKIVDMLKDYYMSNKNIQLKSKTDKKVSENIKSEEIKKESNVIPLNQLKNESKESLIKTKLNNDKLLHNNLNVSDSMKNNTDKLQLKTLEENKESINYFKEEKEHKHSGLFSSLFKKNSKIEENNEGKGNGTNLIKNIRGSVVVSSTEEFLNCMKSRAMENEILEVKVACSNLEVEDKYKNIKYIGGSNTASIILKGHGLFNGRENKISFSNLSITSYEKINFTAEKLEGCLVNKKMVKKDISDLLQKHPNILAKVEESCYLKEENCKITEVENLSMESFIKGIYRNDNDFSEMVGTVKYEGVSIFANVNMGMIDMAFYKTEDKGYEDISHIFQNMECMDIFKRDSDIGLLLKALVSKDNLKKLENIRGKTYNNPKEAIWDLFKENKIEDYLQYIMLMPIKIFKQGMPLNRKEQIRIIELMNIDTGVPFLYRAFSGKRNTVEKDLYNFIEESSLNRENYNVSFKGIVVEVLDQGLRESLGVTEGKSNFEIFFEFKSYIHKTRVKDIKFTLDEEFRLLPLAQIEPVELNGKTLNFVPINDPQKFKSLYLKVDDIIILGLQDGIEPIITKDEELSKNNMNLVSNLPTVCPSCGSPIVFKEIGAFGKCENENCKGNIAYNIYSDLNELGIDIIPLDIINALVKEGYINEVTDLCEFCAEDIANIITTSTEEVKTALNIIKYANKAI